MERAIDELRQIQEVCLKADKVQEVIKDEH